MSFERQGSPEPIQQSKFILDDAKFLVCQCGQKFGYISHGVIAKPTGEQVVNIQPIKCPKCGNMVTPKPIGGGQ